MKWFMKTLFESAYESAFAIGGFMCGFALMAYMIGRKLN